MEHREREQQQAVGRENDGDKHWEWNQPKKLQMHEKLQLIACNVRGINTHGRRQELSEQWERYKIGIAMISEAQKNTGGMGKGGPWGKYACFYSSGIIPKLRDAQEKKRENKTAKVRRKLRKIKE